MSSTAWFVALILAVGVERIVELIVSQRHIAWAKARGGVEVAGGHYPAMVLLHVGLLVGSIVEVVAAEPGVLPVVGVDDVCRRLARTSSALVVHQHARATVEHPEWWLFRAPDA